MNPYQPPGNSPPGWGPPPGPWPHQPQQQWVQQPFGGTPFGAPSAQPPSPEQQAVARRTFAESEIADYANYGLLGAIVGFVCMLGIISGPIAFYRGNKALDMIAQHNIGHQHATKAQAARIIGAISMLTCVGAIAWWVFLAA
ncbi:MAG: hypothetical protein HOW73_30575 [Polyangiaceae bacterium]|nr:hypothetical protein [Polyangiaceae bacterium]